MSCRKGLSKRNVSKGKHPKCPDLKRIVYFLITDEVSGGTLLQCSYCHRTFHFLRQDPQNEVPGNLEETFTWHCSQCVENAFHESLEMQKRIQHLLFFKPMLKWGTNVYLRYMSFEDLSLLDGDYYLKKLGYFVFRSRRVRNMVSAKLYHFVFILTVIEPSAITLTCFDKSSTMSNLRWCSCSCSPTNKMCHHIIATLFALQDCILLGRETFPWKTLVPVEDKNETAEDETEKFAKEHLKKLYMAVAGCSEEDVFFEDDRSIKSATSADEEIAKVLDRAECWAKVTCEGSLGHSSKNLTE